MELPLSVLVELSAGGGVPEVGEAAPGGVVPTGETTPPVPGAAVPGRPGVCWPAGFTGPGAGTTGPAGLGRPGAPGAAGVAGAPGVPGKALHCGTGGHMHCPEDMSPGTGAPAAPVEGSADPLVGAAAPDAPVGVLPSVGEVALAVASVAGAVALAAPGAPAEGLDISIPSIGAGLLVEALAWAAKAAIKAMTWMEISMMAAELILQGVSLMSEDVTGVCRA